MIWALSEYAHRCLGLPDQIDLRAHLGLAEREEPALHALRKFYRNHFFHAMEVCFLGHFLLEMEVTGIPLWKRALPSLPLAGTKEDVLKLWYLAALLHDVGYAVDLAKGVRDVFRTLGAEDILGEFVQGIDITILRVSQRLAGEKFQNYSLSDKPGEDHGVVGAQHMRALLAQIPHPAFCRWRCRRKPARCAPDHQCRFCRESPIAHQGFVGEQTAYEGYGSLSRSHEALALPRRRVGLIQRLRMGLAAPIKPARGAAI